MGIPGFGKQDGFEDLVKNFSKYSAIALAWAVCVSSIYEIAYSRIIGISFFSIMSTLELAKTGIQWFYIASIVSIVIPTIVEKLKKLPTDKPLKYLRKKINSYPRSFVAILSFSYLTAVAYYLDSVLACIEILSSVAFFYISETISDRFPPETGMTRRFALIVSVFLVMLIVAILEGQRQAMTDLNRTSPISKILAADQDPMNVIIYRLLEKGVLFKKTNGTTTLFVPWDNLKSIETSDMSAPGMPEIEGFAKSILSFFNYLADLAIYIFNRAREFVHYIYTSAETAISFLTKSIKGRIDTDGKPPPLQ